MLMKKTLLKITLILAVLVFTVALGCIAVGATDAQAQSSDTPVYGDVNGDGAIDLIDVVLLRRHLTSGGNVENGANVDGDKENAVEVDDLVLLRQYMAYYNYETKEGAVRLGYEDTLDEVNNDFIVGGYTLTQYNGRQKADYLAFCNSYVREGYTLYSSNAVGETLSSVYKKGNAYVTVMFNALQNELYVGNGSGANNFPEKDNYVAKAGDITTVTQIYSRNVNGMGYIIKLADGSFLVVDGGYADDFVENDSNDSFVHENATHLYNTLVSLNGSEDNIHIRAWLLTHSHGDHYQAFHAFARQKDEGNYAGVNVGTVLCSPVQDVMDATDGANKYFTDDRLVEAVFTLGANLVYVHTGMSFEFADVTLEILVAPEHVYKFGDPEDFNETSVVSRIKNKDGSMIFLGDAGMNACNWMVGAYGEGLESDMVQVSHHGGETATKAIYQNIKAHTLFWPSSEGNLNQSRGDYTKQYLLESEYSKEHILHEYGNATRELGYGPETKTLDILNNSKVQKVASGNANMTISNGVITYKVTGSDPFVRFNFNASLDAMCSEYNAVKLVVNADIMESGRVGEMRFWMQNESYSAANNIRRQGTSEDGKMTLIYYFGNKTTYDITKELGGIRFDLGSVGDTVTIYSAELYHVDVDPTLE